MAPIAVPLNQNVAVADLNGDDRLDVVTTYGRATVLPGNGDGTVQAPAHAGTTATTVATTMEVDSHGSAGGLSLLI